MYTIVDHVKDAIIESAVIRGTAKVDAAKETYTLPPFFKSDAAHPAVGGTVSTPLAPAVPNNLVNPNNVAGGADQQAQIYEVQKQIADLHATLRQAVARANDPVAP